MGTWFIHGRPHVAPRGAGILLLAWLILMPLPCRGGVVDEVVRQNEGAAVVVMGERPGVGLVQGSGCFVSSAGYVLTSLHQVEGLSNIRVKLASGSEWGAQLAARAEAQDLALLKTAVKPEFTARVGDAWSLRNGSLLVAIAAPDNLEFSTVTGVVSNINRTYKGMRVIQSDLRASPGSSGAPVFNERGALVGTIIGQLEGQSWVTVINPVNNAYELLQRHGAVAPSDRISQSIPDEGEIVPLPEAGALEREAIELYNRGVAADSPEKKIDAYSRAVKLLPGFYEAWFNLGVASAAAGDGANAERAYRTAEQLRPDAAEVQRNLGRVLLGLEQPDAAAACFERAVELEPKAAWAHNDLGEAYRRLGRLSEAEKSFLAALAIDERHGAALYNLALTYAGQGRCNEAAQYLGRYLEAQPAAADADLVRQWMRELEVSK